jgi:hypothetical protein
VAISLVSITTLTIVDGISSNLYAVPATNPSTAKYDYEIETRCIEKPVHLTGCSVVASGLERCDKIAIVYKRSCVQKVEVQK